jgi:hypothetical protein
MIIVYTGSIARISFETKTRVFQLRKGVPTWLPESARPVVESHPDCAEWEHESVEPGEDKIFVGFPKDLHLFAAAQFALAKIRSGFPTCQIECTCRSEFTPLLPSGITRLNYRSAQTDYYRQFQLTKQAIPNNNDPWIENLIRWQRLTMIGGGVFDPIVDTPDQGETFPGAKSETGHVVIVDKGLRADCTIPGAPEIAEKLESKLSFVSRIAEYADQNLADQIDLIRHAETTVHLGYTHLAYLSAALGIRTLMIRKTGFTKDVWPNFEHFKNAEVIKTAGANGPSEIAEIILGMVGKPKDFYKVKATRKTEEPIIGYPPKPNAQPRKRRGPRAK